MLKRRPKNPVIYLCFYIFVCLILWIGQNSLYFSFNYGFIILVVSYLYFSFGCYIGHRTTGYHEYDMTRRNHLVTNLSSLIVPLLFVNLVVLFYLTFLFKGIISGGISISAYRDSLFKDQSIKDYYGTFAAYLFLYATLVPLFGISYGLYLKINRNKSKILIFSLLMLICKEGILISRYYVFPPVLAAIVMMYCYDSRMTLKKVVLTLTVFLGLILAIFAFRGDSELSQSLYNARNYAVAGYSLFTHAIDTGDTDTFYELSSPFAFFGILGAKFYDQSFFFSKVQEFVYLGDAGYFNAFYTSLLLPFIYFGSIGLCVGSMLYGYLISRNHKKFIYNNSLLGFNSLFALLIIFFSHQFLPVQLSFFWDYFLISILVHLFVICIRNIRSHF